MYSNIPIVEELTPVIAYKLKNKGSIVNKIAIKEI